MIRKFAAALVIVIVAFCTVIFWSYSSAVFTIPVTEKVVALTYDDGPNPPHTQAMLNMLAQHGVKATFFLKGRNVEAYPAAVRALAEAGHEIGNHSYSHRAMPTLDRAAMYLEVVRTNHAIEAVLGKQPELFRPPYGLQGPGLKRALAELGMTSILMSTSGSDWELTNPRQIASAILESIEPGGIILLHDGHGDVDDPAGQDSRAASVAASGIIIESLRSQGYRFATVGEMLAMAEQ